ncbi:unnamed protein product [Cuscuta campestris]|uniref:BZIP domain-containing protein n=1 Tax=Cuscuta campestris TaxID=132261 RepID=A0A484MGN5_9ASTE|nr:unnamed protein product [Cuscuta campestris]
MTGGGEDWVGAAMADDSMVVELLLGLSRRNGNRSPILPLKWRARQRRSKPAASKNAAARASPNTPLSWSGGTTGSGGGCDGANEESSSRPPPSAPELDRVARSKVNETSEKTAIRRCSRRKRTLAELKNDEAMLLKERKQLKKELAKLRVNFETLRAINENLKRIKIDLVQIQQKPEARHEDKVALPDLNLPFEEDPTL